MTLRAALLACAVPLLLAGSASANDAPAVRVPGSGGVDQLGDLSPGYPAPANAGVSVTWRTCNWSAAICVANPGFLSGVTADVAVATGYPGQTSPVDWTGTADSAPGINGALAYAASLLVARGHVRVVLPCGTYRINSTLAWSTDYTSLDGVAPACVILERFADFGPAIKVSKTSGMVQSPGIHNIAVWDVPALNGSPTYSTGWTTQANSPFQIDVNGAYNANLENISIQGSGYGGLALHGVQVATLRNLNFQIAPIPGFPAYNGMGVGLYVGYSTAQAIHSATVNIDDLQIEGGVITTPGGVTTCTPKLYDGVSFDGIDGGFLNGKPHVQCTSNADFHFAHNGTYPEANIHAPNLFADLTNGYGVLMDGTKRVIQSNIGGTLSSLGAASLKGFYLTGAGGAADLTLDVQALGWGQEGVSVNAASANGVTDLVFHPRQVRNNNQASGGTACAASFQNVTRMSISGGSIGGDGVVKCGVALGSGVNTFAMSGVPVTGTAGYALTIAAGATSITAVGNNFWGNANPGVLDNTVSSTPKLIGYNLGQTGAPISGP